MCVCVWLLDSHTYNTQLTIQKKRDEFEPLRFEGALLLRYSFKFLPHLHSQSTINHSKWNINNWDNCVPFHYKYSAKFTCTFCHNFPAITSLGVIHSITQPPYKTQWNSTSALRQIHTQEIFFSFYQIFYSILRIFHFSLFFAQSYVFVCALFLELKDLNYNLLELSRFKKEREWMDESVSVWICRRNQLLHVCLFVCCLMHLLLIWSLIIHVHVIRNGECIESFV